MCQLSQVILLTRLHKVHRLQLSSQMHQKLTTSHAYIKTNVAAKNDGPKQVWVPKET